MATKSNPGAFDCYTAAAPDEPLFTLLGRDRHAPTLVWLWATLRELDGEDPAKVAEAHAVCDEMIKWAHAHNRPVLGFGQAALTGIVALTRTLNQALKKLEKEPRTEETGVKLIRMFLAEASLADNKA